MKLSAKQRPIGQLLRNSNTYENRGIVGKSLLSLDEQIALLEKSVQLSGSDSEFDSDVSDSERRDNDVIVEPDSENHLLIEKDLSGKVVRIVSSIDKDKIDPLPKEKLPGINCSTSKKYSKLPEESDRASKRIRFNGPSNSTNSSSSTGRGLEATVRELIKQYEPASREKRPFYCRVCKHQAENLADFEAHRSTEFHITATEMERKMTFCRLCKKQFTSPEQLKEHLKGKGHIEKLEKAKEYQQSQKKFS